MKNLKISMFALAALAFGACTDNDVALTDNATINNGEGGDGYVSLSINLPTTASTRANDEYDDGIAAEYNVNDVTLYLFGGADEASATLYASYTLSGNWSTYDPANDNITSNQQFTQEITRPTSGDLFALVVVNGSGVTAPTTGATLATLQNIAVTMDVETIASVSNANFYMTNAPLWNGSRGGYVSPTGEVTTLVHIDGSKIYDTAAAAEANPATEIYVERGVAKVTVDGTNASSQMTEDGEGVEVTVNGFVLDLTNLSGYPVRNAGNSQNWWTYASGNTAVVGGAYRMVGNTEVGADLYRTYWAVDPNYDDTMYTSGESGNRTYPATVSSLAGTAPTTLIPADGESGAYCLENTFSTAHQMQDETTRAIIAVTLGDGSDFYTFEGDKSVLYTEEEICNEVLALFAANGDIENAITSSWIGGDFDYTGYYTASVTVPTTGGSSDVDVNVTLTGTFDENDFLNGEIPTILTSFDEVVAAINDDHEFSYYADGVAYYPVLIKHFGDDLTPWMLTDAADGNSYPDGVYNTTGEESWLGRYGVLRNNWYDITVTAVNSIGSAVVPPAYGVYDDPVESWISVNINILSWAKRSQDVTL